MDPKIQNGDFLENRTYDFDRNLSNLWAPSQVNNTAYAVYPENNGMRTRGPKAKCKFP
jgi:hypothetical protein